MNRYFTKQIQPDDVVWTYAGVRPLLEDGAGDAASATRDYQLELDTNGAPLMSVFGGKITTFRKLAEQAADELAIPLGLKGEAWTHLQPLPGGDIPHADFTRFTLDFGARHSFLPTPLAQRLARAYGTRAEAMLAGIRSLDDLGEQTFPACIKPRPAISSTKNGRAPRTTFCGAAPSSALKRAPRTASDSKRGCALCRKCDRDVPAPLRPDGWRMRRPQPDLAPTRSGLNEFAGESLMVTRPRATWIMLICSRPTLVCRTRAYGAEPKFNGRTTARQLFDNGRLLPDTVGRCCDIQG